jgi:hypothetical protein
MTDPGRRLYYTFYYHPTSGLDGNGNGGPSLTDPGWRAIAVRADGPYDYQAALQACPDDFKEKVLARIRKERVDYHGSEHWKCGQCSKPDCIEFICFCADTCMWGVPFSFMDEETWQNELRNQDYVPS